MRKFLLFLILLFPNLALGQSQRNPCFYVDATGGNSVSNCNPVTTHAPLPVTGNSNVDTFGAAVVNQAYTVAGDIYCIIGSSTKIVRIKGIRISAIATAAIVGDVSIILRSTLDTGGGLASVPLVKNDSLNFNPTATVNSFTSAPTTGTAIGTIRTKKLAAGTQGNSSTTTEGLFQFTVYWDQPLTLRGANQSACVNVSAFGAGAAFNIDHEHTEE